MSSNTLQNLKDALENLSSELKSRISSSISLNDLKSFDTEISEALSLYNTIENQEANITAEQLNELYETINNLLSSGALKGDKGTSITNVNSNGGNLIITDSNNKTYNLGTFTNDDNIIDYEEGHWDGKLSFDGVSSGVSYSYKDFTYIKIGNLVQVNIILSFISIGDLVGIASINLPFTAINLIPGTGFTYILNLSPLFGGSGELLDSTVYVNSNEGNIVFTKPLNSTVDKLNESAFQVPGNIRISGTYYTS